MKKILAHILFVSITASILAIPALAEEKARLKPIIAASAKIKRPPVDLRRLREQLKEKRELASGEPRPEHSYWASGSVVGWNGIARELVIQHKTPPPVASRVYALISVAQNDSIAIVQKNNRSWSRRLSRKRIRPSVVRHIRASEEAAVAATSHAVLTYLYPQSTALLAEKYTENLSAIHLSGRDLKLGLSVGEELGAGAAERVIDYAKADGSDLTFTGTIPSGPGLWFSSANPPAAPLLPRWGEVKPWLVPDISSLRPPAPPAFDSEEFRAALAEVRAISDSRTPEQLRIARFWADGPGTSTPPGHWNEIAVAALLERRADQAKIARTLAWMNMALMDAGISCWDAKYTYWLLRPSQADANITTPVGLPNFPAFTSGHSTFSAAAATVLGEAIPEMREAFNSMAEEAAVSRLYGGIHYRFDSEVGLEIGRRIGSLAAERMD